MSSKDDAMGTYPLEDLVCPVFLSPLRQPDRVRLNDLICIWEFDINAFPDECNILLRKVRRRKTPGWNQALQHLTEEAAKSRNVGFDAAFFAFAEHAVSAMLTSRGLLFATKKP
jgi:hypothetical protein